MGNGNVTLSRVPVTERPCCLATFPLCCVLKLLFSLYVRNYCSNLSNFVTNGFSDIENMVLDTTFMYLGYVV